MTGHNEQGVIPYIKIVLRLMQFMDRVCENNPMYGRIAASLVSSYLVNDRIDKDETFAILRELSGKIQSDNFFSETNIIESLNWFEKFIDEHAELKSMTLSKTLKNEIIVIVCLKRLAKDKETKYAFGILRREEFSKYYGSDISRYMGYALFLEYILQNADGIWTDDFYNDCFINETIFENRYIINWLKNGNTVKAPKMKLKKLDEKIIKSSETQENFCFCNMLNLIENLMRIVLTSNAESSKFYKPIARICLHIAFSKTELDFTTSVECLEMAINLAFKHLHFDTNLSTIMMEIQKIKQMKEVSNFTFTSRLSLAKKHLYPKLRISGLVDDPRKCFCNRLSDCCPIIRCLSCNENSAQVILKNDLLERLETTSMGLNKELQFEADTMPAASLIMVIENSYETVGVCCTGPCSNFVKKSWWCILIIGFVLVYAFDYSIFILPIGYALANALIYKRKPLYRFFCINWDPNSDYY